MIADLKPLDRTVSDVATELGCDWHTVSSRPESTHPYGCPWSCPVLMDDGPLVSWSQLTWISGLTALRK